MQHIFFLFWLLSISDTSVVYTISNRFRFSVENRNNFHNRTKQTIFDKTIHSAKKKKKPVKPICHFTKLSREPLFIVNTGCLQSLLTNLNYCNATMIRLRDTDTVREVVCDFRPCVNPSFLVSLFSTVTRIIRLIAFARTELLIYYNAEEA